MTRRGRSVRPQPPADPGSWLAFLADLLGDLLDEELQNQDRGAQDGDGYPTTGEPSPEKEGDHEA